jgi:hypothetical protein
VFNRRPQIGKRADWLLIHLLNHVTSLNSRFSGWSRGIDFYHHQSLGVSAYS